MNACSLLRQRSWRKSDSLCSNMSRPTADSRMYRAAMHQLREYTDRLLDPKSSMSTHADSTWPRLQPEIPLATTKNPSNSTTSISSPGYEYCSS